MLGWKSAGPSYLLLDVVQQWSQAPVSGGHLSLQLLLLCCHTLHGRMRMQQTHTGNTCQHRIGCKMMAQIGLFGHADCCEAASS